ncbi:hypothetical protein [Sphingomonas aerophila]|jgi:uncharacterized membrane protein|uniref:Putative membrane protein n=1 Tax=Sphingomonas aerophila TaxID=1344948 RepID=A0A7W9EWI3_9SPHN|nr:hypothetical protein [Sphingomonas aerophila]MBB5715747.1 putative membrane protein [Sphingomonas aerophila]
MGRHMLTELLNLVAGLLVALAVAAAVAWAYPLGRDVIWACGIFGAVATVLMSIGPLRRAQLLDRSGR